MCLENISFNEEKSYKGHKIFIGSEHGMRRETLLLGRGRLIKTLILKATISGPAITETKELWVEKGDHLHGWRRDDVIESSGGHEKVRFVKNKETQRTVSSNRKGQISLGDIENARKELIQEAEETIDDAIDEKLREYWVEKQEEDD